MDGRVRGGDALLDGRAIGIHVDRPLVAALHAPKLGEQDLLGPGHGHLHVLGTGIDTAELGR